MRSSVKQLAIDEGTKISDKIVNALSIYILSRNFEMLGNDHISITSSQT